MPDVSATAAIIFPIFTSTIVTVDIPAPAVVGHSTNDGTTGSTDRGALGDITARNGGYRRAARRADHGATKGSTSLTPVSRAGGGQHEGG